MVRQIVYFNWLALILALTACSPKLGLKARDANHQALTQKEESEQYKKIETLFSQQSPLFESHAYGFLQKYRRSTFIPNVENLRGLFLLQKKQAALALPHFKRALQHSGTQTNASQYYAYNLATALHEAGRSEDAQQILNGIQLQGLDRPNRAKVHYLKATLFEKQALPQEAARQLLAAGDLFIENTAHGPATKTNEQTTFDTYLESLLTQLAEPKILQALYNEYENSPNADAVLFRLGSYEASTGDLIRAEQHLKLLLARYPTSRYFSRSSETLTSLLDKSQVDRQSIGILIPRSGKFASFANRALQAIEMAFDIFGSQEPNTHFNLIIEDSGDEPEQAIDALTRLVIKHHVIAVIGPLLSKGIDQVSLKAHELGVPLISLARREPQTLSDFVFQGGLTENQQVIELAKYAVNKLGVKRFAMIYPNDKMGFETGRTFFDSVEALGGQIVGVETYTPGETDFRLTIDKLAGLFYTASRQRELAELAQSREQNGIKKRTRKTEQYFALKPIVDFDATLIIGDAQVAGQIIPTFAYRDIEHTKFLGTSAWNSPDFLTRTQNYSEHAIFVDSFFSESTSPAVKDFILRYKTIYGQDPESLEILAYDSAHILYETLSKNTECQTRLNLQDALKQLKNYKGVTSSISYQDGRFMKNLTVISAKNGHFIEL